MATDHLQIPDIQASQNQKEVTANAAHNLLDRAMNQIVQKAVVLGAQSFTTTETRENTIIELTGTPGGAVQVDMPDTNQRKLTVVNNSDGAATIRNSASAGTGQPTIAAGASATFHYDGTNFIDYSALYAGGGGNSRTVATAQTTDATVTTLASESLAAGETKTIRGFGMAQGPSNASVGFNFVGTAHNNGGTTTFDGRVVDTLDDNGNGWKLDIDADDTSDTLRVRITGAGATTIDWRVEYDLTTET